MEWKSVCVRNWLIDRPPAVSGGFRAVSVSFHFPKTAILFSIKNTPNVNADWSNACECMRWQRVVHKSVFFASSDFFPSFLLPLLGRSERGRGISIIAILHGLATTAETRKTSFYESSKKLRFSLFLLYVVVAAVEKRF